MALEREWGEFLTSWRIARRMVFCLLYQEQGNFPFVWKVKKYTIIVLSYLTIINICEKCGAISYWQNDSRKKNSNNIDNIETKIYHKWVWNCHIAHASNSKIYIVRWWIKMIKCYLQCIEATYHLAMNVLIDKGISIKKI